MTYQVRVLKEAQKDLSGIHAYVQSSFGSAVAARVYREIRDAIFLLKDNPMIGAPVTELIPLGMLQYRHMLVQKQNKVVYEIDEPGRTVYVHIICSTRQDYATVLYQRLLRIA